jgi:4-amino-4-deoxy-L-arabinose transferase-like glycosyltransferase
MFAGNALPAPGRVYRREWVLLLLLLLLGLSLRAWQIASVGLDHFDEGVYVFSALGLSDATQPNLLYPEQWKFSPPVYISLVALAYKLIGPSDTAAVLVNIFLGTLTIAAVWWLGRRWFGPPAGIAAAALISLSEFHIALSRAALTDVAFAFFFIVALGLITLALERDSVKLAILAGLVVGIAWNTKYHGWFALVITGLALLPYAYVYRTRGLALARLLFLYVVISAVAGITFLPWALFVQSQPGGYRALLEYQRTLIDAHWRTNLITQVQMMLFSEGPLTRVSIPVALFCASLLAPRGRIPAIRLLVILVLLCVAALTVGGAGTAALLSLLALPGLLKRKSSLAAWMALSGLAVWFFTTPLYHPYARLLLPFILTIYLVAGFLMATLLRASESAAARDLQPALAAGIGVVMVSVVALAWPRTSDPWRPSRSAPEAVAAMNAIIPVGSRVIVIGEPEVAFYFHLTNRPAFERVEDPVVWKSIQTPAFMVAGVYAKRATVLREGLEKLGARLVPLGKYPVEPNDLRLLDDFSPQDARTYREHPDDTFELTLYKLGRPD